MINRPSQILQRHSGHTPYICATRHFDVKVVSAGDQKQMKAELSSVRPISPHFNIYKWPIAGLASGAQRVTGFTLVVGWTAVGLLSLPGLPITLLPAVIEAVKSVPFIHATVKGGIAFAFGYHGTKNLFMPRMEVLNIEGVHRAAYFAIAGGLSCA